MNGPRALLALFVVIVSIGWAWNAPAQDGDDALLLKTQSQQLLDAVASGNRAVWERYLHQDLIHVDENGIQRTKAQLLEEIEPLPPGLVGRIEIDRFDVRFHGDTAVTAYELQEYLSYYGQDLHSRFRGMDTWLHTNEGWRLIGGHTATVLKDPPAARIAAARLCDYEGSYRLTPSIQTTIQREGDGLRAQREGRPPAMYLPEVVDVFFAPGQPRTRRIFVRDEAGRVTGFADRREGEDVRWTRHEGPGESRSRSCL